MKLGRALAFAALVISCTKSRDPAPVVTTASDPLAPLRSFEEERRHAVDWRAQPVQDRAFGADPYALVALEDGRFAGILRGRDALVILDANLASLDRLPTPRSPSAIARDGNTLYVASELEPVLARYRIGANVTRLPDLPVGVTSVRDVTATNGVVHLIEEHGDRLIELGEKRTEYQVPKGPIRLARTPRAVFVVSLIDHSISAYPLDTGGHIAGEPRKTAIDGPFWSIAVQSQGESDLVLAGGAEDHPLDRTGGFFGYVDSFVYGFRYSKGNFEKRFALNVGAAGLIVPKAIDISPPATNEAFVTSYGGDRALRINTIDGSILESIPFPPGTSAIARGHDGHAVAANPLLDAWVTEDRIVRIEPDGARPERERLGEALFFTGLMAPHADSDGARSRFTCETCHFEGYVDGRTHHTGRGDVRATTKPLVGLFNNRPHFSRALDPDLSAVAENEFRVAGSPAPDDPHFALEPPAWLGLSSTSVDATELRRSLIAFLMAWTHRTNPAASTFSEKSRAGAAIFRDRCERCHSARLASDDATTRVPFERWESLTLNGGPIVWGSDAYEKTGIEPYVHDLGARVPSLRRLYKKRPYFTNGSAPDLESVLSRVRLEPFSHAAKSGDLDQPSIAALLAFLDLL